MEELALQLRNQIDTICGGYHYYKDENVIENARKLSGEIQEYCSYFLNGNQFGMNDEEYAGLQEYVLQVLRDYVEALELDDLVYMLDTLDYGLRELLELFIDDDIEELVHE